MRIAPLLVLASALALSACNNEQADPNSPQAKRLKPASSYSISEEDEQLIAQLYPGIKPSSTGLYSIVRSPGTGTAKPKYGAIVTMNYELKTLKGEVLETTAKEGKPLVVPIGVGRVIRGWDEAVMEMTKGERRTLIIPHYLGYGVTGNPPKILPYATLIFEVELLDFK